MEPFGSHESVTDYQVCSCTYMLPVVFQLDGADASQPEEDVNIRVDHSRFVTLMKGINTCPVNCLGPTITQAYPLFSDSQFDNNAFLTLRCPLWFGCACRCQRLAS